jgi:hypothetical protein
MEEIMSRFKELCEAFSNDSDFYRTNYNNLTQFLGIFLNKLTNYLELPKENLYFTPLNDNHEDNKEYFIHGATHLNKDTYFHTGVIFVIERAKNISPKKRLVLTIKTKIVDNTVKLKFSSDEKEFTYQISDYENRFEEALSFVFNLLMNNTKDQFKNWLSDSNNMTIEKYNIIIKENKEMN